MPRKGQHTVDQLERVPMGRLEAVNLSSDVVRVALALGPEVEEEPLHAPNPPVGIYSPKSARRGSCRQSEQASKPNYMADKADFRDRLR